MDCPSCHKDVPVTESNYGALYTCATCQAVYFINFDGQPEFENAPSDISNAPVSPTYPLTENEQSSQLQSPTTITEINQSGMNDLFQLQTEPLSPLQNAMADIENFANQDVDASLTFNLIVSGLDTKGILAQFFDCINDSKFGWMAEDIIKNVQQGRCEIKDIKPVSAHVLAKRLRYMDVQLEWIFTNAI
jgi:hypothetical protein